MNFDDMDLVLRELRAMGRRVVFRGSFNGRWWLEVSK